MVQYLDKQGLEYLWPKIKALGINAVSVSVDNTTGTPAASATLDNGTLRLVFSGMKGQQGEKGDTTVIGSGETYTLYNILGENTDGAVTQAKVTEYINSLFALHTGRKVVVYWDADNTNYGITQKYYTADKNGQYNAVVTPNAGFCIDENQTEITMDGTDITDTAYNEGTVSIPRVTGNVEITVGTTSVTKDTMLTKRTTGDGINILNDKALLKGVRGNSLQWNQKVNLASAVSPVQLTEVEKDEYHAKYTVQTSGVTTSSAPRFGYNIGTVGHVFYYRMDVYIDTDSTVAPRFGAGWTTSRNSMSGTHTADRTANTWFTVEELTTLGTSHTWLLLAWNNSNDWVNKATYREVQVKNLVVLDLTVMFGAGNEPTTAQLKKLFPMGDYYAYSANRALDNNMTNLVEYDTEDNTLQSVSLNIPTLTGKLNGTGESVTIFPSGMKSSVDAELNPVYDEIKHVDGVWMAYKRCDDTRTSNADTGRAEYDLLADEEVYVLDDQTIPTEITVANGGTEEILPTNGSTPTTAPAIVEIQYGAKPTLGFGFGFGNPASEPEDEGEEVDEEPIEEETSEEEETL